MAHAETARRRRVLWIEDEAFIERSKHFAGPVYASGKYRMDIAETVTDGVLKLCQAKAADNPYEAVVIDIRFGLEGERLGWHLLLMMFGKESELLIEEHDVPESWRSDVRCVNTDKLGILTVESPELLASEMNLKGVSIPEDRLVDKNSAPGPALLDLLDLILE